jgi:hypothetical protein
MSKILLHCGVAAIALTAVFGWSLTGQAQDERDLTVQQSHIYHSGQTHPSSLSIVALLDRADATYAVGESLRLAVKSNEDAYVTVFDIGPTGNVTQLFPNRAQKDSRIKAGELKEIPSKSSNTKIEISGPVGAELIKVIATSKPLTVVPEGHFRTATGDFRDLDGGVDTLDRDLVVVTSKPQPEMKVAVVNQVIKTVRSRPASAAPAGGFVVPAGSSSMVVPVIGAPSSAFPVLLAADKSNYRNGEPVVLAVTSLEACHLKVVDINAKGRARTLFPTHAFPSDQINPLQTVMISGGPSPQTLVANGSGQESIVALCTREPHQTHWPLRSLDDYLDDNEKSDFDKDLSVVPNRPARSTGVAQISLTITP